MRQAAAARVGLCHRSEHKPASWRVRRGPFEESPSLGTAVNQQAWYTALRARRRGTLPLLDEAIERDPECAEVGSSSTAAGVLKPNRRENRPSTAGLMRDDEAIERLAGGREYVSAAWRRWRSTPRRGALLAAGRRAIEPGWSTAADHPLDRDGRPSRFGNVEKSGLLGNFRPALRGGPCRWTRRA